MRALRLTDSTRALTAGAICVAIVGGMLIGHAWPLWTGQDVLMAATVNGAPRWTSGEYVSLSTRAERLMVGGATPTADSEWTAVPTVEPWPKADASRPDRLVRRMRGRIVYVQLDRGPDGVLTPVSVSLRAVGGAVNLRGIVASMWGDGRLTVRYGLDAFYMQQGHAQAIERAFGEKRRVQVQVAIAKSGRARIRNLLVDGVPVS